MSLFEQFKTDADKEKNGVRIEYGANADKTVPTFIISRMSKVNKKYTKAIEVSTRPYRRQIELEIFPEDKAVELMKKVFVDTVLLGWENVQDENGVLIPFNRDNALELFGKLPELYEDLEAQAKKAALFRVEAQEAEAKN